MPAALVVAAFSIACAYTNPVQPLPTPLDTSSPFTLTMGASSNTVTARVQNANGAPLGNIVVRFATNRGSVSPDAATTGPDGRAATTVTASDTAEVSATAGTLTARWLVAAQNTVGAPPAPALSSTFLNASPNATTGTPLAFSVSSSAPGPWSWSFGDGENTQGSAFVISHAYSRPGVYTASVSGPGTSVGSAIITVSDPK